MHFIHSYPGNKRKECDNLLNHISDEKIIIEPFCGTSALSFYHYRKHKNENIKYFLSDMSDELASVYKLLKEETVENIEYNVSQYFEPFENKEYRQCIHEDYKKSQTKDIYKFLFLIKSCGMGRLGMLDVRQDISKFKGYKLKFTPIQKEFIEFIKLENVVFKQQNWFEYFNEFKNNKNALIFFDPPYINSDNSLYKNFKNSNVYEYFYKNKISSFESKIFFILEKNWIIELLFNDYIVEEYEKIYSVSKKKVVHIIVKN